MERPGDNILYILDVCKIYGAKAVLDDIDLSVSSGELCTLVGPSGCGKSTLLRLILGQERPTRGEIRIEGKPVGFPNPERGIVYQKYSLFPHLTVLENVMLGKKLSVGLLERRYRLDQFREEAEYYLGKTKLAGHLDKYPHELSGGMQQRVALAQSLIMKPKLLLMDEPFGALDPGTREDMQIFLLNLWEEFKMTIFFVTHDLEEAVFIGTRVLVLSQYYSDASGNAAHIDRGARIVFDYPLERGALSSKVKETARFGQLIQQVRREGFDPEYLQHVADFNLRHPDSFITLSGEHGGRS
jgi:NitT/TauT family transport system ATP-binding protein